MRRLALAVLCCCGTSPEPRPPIEPPASALLPSRGGVFAPALTETRGSGAIDGGVLTNDAADCGVCHPDVAAQWRSSAHAFASFNNPIYRASVDAFRAASGNQASRFCAGCHDVPLLIDGLMDGDVRPAEPRGHGGVTCLSCHAVEHATVDGNGSYTLRTDPIVMPEKGDPQSLAAHATALTASLDKVQLCASCHRAFLGEATGHGHHMAGPDDIGPWSRSVYAGSDISRIDDPIARADCRGCHMPLETAHLGDVAATAGKVRSHRFAGGHSWLATMIGDERGLEASRAMLRKALRVSVVPSVAREFISPGPDDTLDIDVVVRNVGVGHHYPGGTRDAHDSWIELTVRAADGGVVATAGADQARTGTDPSAHRFRALVVDDAGRPALERDVHRFRALVYDRTVAPRDAQVVRYPLHMDTSLAARMPLTIEAVVWHRSRSLEVQRASCQATQDERGRRFAAASERFGMPSLDPCAPQPLTRVAETTIVVGKAVPWQALYDHGLAWSHALGEQLDVARPALELASASAETERQRAAAMQILALVAGRQGRVDEALSWASRANALAVGEPSIDWARGRALAAVWRWDAAADAFGRAAYAAPRHDGAWRELAGALGSVSRNAEALDAAQRGLELVPRQPDLLRAQALALQEIAPEGSDPAFEAFLRHRRRDDAPALRSKCSSADAGCALERSPVHVHALVR